MILNSWLLSQKRRQRECTSLRDCLQLPSNSTLTILRRQLLYAMKPEGSFNMCIKFQSKVLPSKKILINSQLFLTDPLNIDNLLKKSIAIFHTSSYKAGIKAGVVLGVFKSRYRFLKIANITSTKAFIVQSAWFMSKYRILHRSSIKDFPCMLNSFIFLFSLLTITFLIYLSSVPIKIYVLLYPPQTLFVVGILFSRCPCVRPCVRPSVRNVLVFKYLEESLLDFHQTLQTCSYMQDKYFGQKSKG